MKATFVVRLAFATAVLGLLGGCAQLRVSVDVLDADHVKDQTAEQALRNDYRSIVEAPPGKFASKIDHDFKAFQLDLIRLANSYDQLSERFPQPAQSGLREYAEGVRITANGRTLATRVLDRSNQMEELAQEIRISATAIQWTGRGPVPTSVREQLANFSAKGKALSVEQQIDIREHQRARLKISEEAAKINARTAAARAASPVVGASSLGPSPAAVGAEARAIDATPQAQAAVTQEDAALAAAKRRSIIGGSEITHTEFAHIVARAPASYWSTDFNRAFGSGTLGNVDVVIRMNSTADFSVKGMRFDATTVAQVASKVMTQALLIGAQMSGVPVASASAGTQTGGDSLSKSSSDLAALQASLTSREAYSDAQRSAMRALARSILGASPQMEAQGFSTATKTEPARAAMHQSIDAAVGALKPLLSLQGLQ